MKNEVFFLGGGGDLQHDWYLTSCYRFMIVHYNSFYLRRTTCSTQKYLHVFELRWTYFQYQFFPETNCTCIGKALLRRRKKKIFIQRLYNFKTVLKKSNFYLEQNCIENSEKVMQWTRSQSTFIWWKLIGLGWWNSN